MLIVPMHAATAPRIAERRLRLMIGSLGLAIIALIALIDALAGHSA
jgi:hypothetical protein